MPTNESLSTLTTDNPEENTQKTAVLLDVNEVSRMLNCSPRHVYRLADSGKMPRPVKLGTLVRWSRVALENWIAHGCPSCRRARSKQVQS